MPAVEAPYGFPYWLDFDRPAFQTLAGDRVADTVVIGAGIAGLKTARCLARLGQRVIVLEGSHVGAGASSRNQGTINHGPNLGYRECAQLHGRPIARDLWRLGQENQRLLREQIAEHGIDCDYAEGGMTTLIRRDISGWEERLAACRDDYAWLRDDGFDVDLLDERAAQSAGGNALYAGGLRYRTDTQFHSGRFVVGLGRATARLPGVELYEHARVRSIEADRNATRVTTDAGTVTTAAVVLATNALVPQYVPRLTRALRAERGQVIVTEPLRERPCAGSFGTSLAWWREVREADGRFRLLFGGGRTRDEPDSLFPQYTRGGSPHPTLESGGFSPSPEHQHRLDAQLATLFPQLAGVRITHRWGGLQSFTFDNLPQVGLFDAERRMWGMAGFCGRGNCHSDVGAEYLAGRIAGVVSDVERQYGHLFEKLMSVGRASADWPEWKTTHDM